MPDTALRLGMPIERPRKPTGGFASVVAVALIGALAGFGAARLARVDDAEAARSAFILKQNEVALALWRAQGARAEASIAYLHRKGLGVARDEAAADAHYREAVALDEGAAEHAIGLMYLARPTESADPARARDYCDLALRHGVGAARECRDHAATLLSRAAHTKVSTLATHRSVVIPPDGAQE